MSKTDMEIFDLIRESKNPGKMAQYMITLCQEYLQTHGPIEATSSFDPPESA